MAAVALQGVKMHFVIKHVTPRFFGIGAIKWYSVFHQNHIPPVFDKKEQALLEQTGELEKLAYRDVLPAMKSQTCSEFYDPVVSKFINFILREGKKVLARSLVEQTFVKIKRIQLERYHKAKPENRVHIKLDPKEILYEAVKNSTPLMVLHPMKKGAVVYQVPVPILENRQRFLAMNWLIQAGQDKDGRIPFTTQLAKELLDASMNQGRVVKKKQELHKQCEANRAYAHFRWL